MNFVVVVHLKMNDDYDGRQTEENNVIKSKNSKSKCVYSHNKKIDKKRKRRVFIHEHHKRPKEHNQSIQRKNHKKGKYSIFVLKDGIV